MSQVYMDHKYIGTVKKPKEFIEQFLSERRMGELPADVNIARVSWVEASPPVSEFAAPRHSRRKPPSVLAHVRLEFDEEVRGPVLLGRQRYLGMGLFHPYSGRETA